MFCIRDEGEGECIFNIRGDWSVIQASFKEVECNLLIEIWSDHFIK